MRRGLLALLAATILAGRARAAAAAVVIDDFEFRRPSCTSPPAPP